MEEAIKNDFFLENAKKHRCPNCKEVVFFENLNKILFRNISLVYIEKETGVKKTKCRKCGMMITVEQF